MLYGIPAWVIGIVLTVVTAAVVGIIIAIVLRRLVGESLDDLVYGLLGKFDTLLTQRKQEVSDMEAIHAEARQILTTMSAFEMDTSLPLKLRQQAAGLRVAQLLYGYEQAVKSLRASNKVLTDARHGYDTENYGPYRNGYREHITRTLEAINEQEERLLEIEQQLDQANVVYEKLVRPVRAV